MSCVIASPHGKLKTRAATNLKRACFQPVDTIIAFQTSRLVRDAWNQQLTFSDLLCPRTLVFYRGFGDRA